MHVQACGTGSLHACTDMCTCPHAWPWNDNDVMIEYKLRLIGLAETPT